MVPSLEITFLGTGPSTGVPVMTCDCSVCTSENPKNSRTRASIWVKSAYTQILVDSGPDLREQALREGMLRIDAILYTHGHADHVSGFDDLRAFCWRREKALPLFTNPGTLQILKNMFGWAFSPENTYKGYVKPAPVLYNGIHRVGDIDFEAIPVEHGNVETDGLLFHHASVAGSFAYLPDVKNVPETSLKKLYDLDTLVIDTLRDSEHATHLSLPETLEILAELTPKRAFLTHLSHEFDHNELSARLPKNVHVAYDGLKLTYP